MTRTATIITAIVVVLIVAGGFWLFMQPAVSPGVGTEVPSGKISADTDAAIRAAVSGFGSKLKNVSLLSTSTIVADIGTQYGPYLSADLLAHWEADPSLALGREVSSPWPDRIEVTSVTASGDNVYTVLGNVVEVTSVDTASSTPNTYPVTLTVSQQNGAWVITAVTRGS